MEYEEIFADFKDSRLDEYCCYCGNYRMSVQTTKDHIPSGGLLNDPDRPGACTVRVCAECNRRHSPLEQYAYCAISSFASGSSKHGDQVLTKAQNILRSDKRMRRKIWSQLNTDERGRLFWKPDFEMLDNFFVKQAIGHAFLETGETFIDNPPIVNWWLVDHWPHSDRDFFLEAKSNIFPELGSRAFLRMLSVEGAHSDFETDESGFLVVEFGNYRFRVITRRDGIEVQSIIREMIATSVKWHI